MEWVPAVKDFGYPVAISLILGWFFIKTIWPFIVNRLDKAEAKQEHQQTEFMKALERRDAGFEAVVEELRQIKTAVGVGPTRKRKQQ